jgi:hypothetical protein
MATCKSCKCESKYCGCADKAIPTAPPCGQGTADCPEPEPCSETFSAECIVWTGDDLPQFGIQKGDRLDDIIQRIILWQLTPGCINPYDSQFPNDPLNNCVAVTGLHTTQIAASYVKLVWTSSPTALNYTVVYKKVTDPTWTAVTPNTTTNYFTVLNLAANTNYYFKIVTNCASGSCESLILELNTLPF